MHSCEEVEEEGEEEKERIAKMSLTGPEAEQLRYRSVASWLTVIIESSFPVQQADPRQQKFGDIFPRVAHPTQSNSNPSAAWMDLLLINTFQRRVHRRPIFTRPSFEASKIAKKLFHVTEEKKSSVLIFDGISDVLTQKNLDS